MTTDAADQIMVPTQGPGFYEITDQAQSRLSGNGLLTLFIRHTSASLLVQENADPEVQTDLAEFFGRLVPPASHPSMSYLTHTYEGSDDMPAHIKAALLPTHLSIPVQDGRMVLGAWQGIYLVEHRLAPHRRTVTVSFLGNG